MNLSDRMKSYEDVTRIKLTRRTPVIIRVDGKAFHTLTKNLEKPFSKFFEDIMDSSAISVCKEIQNCQLAYIQSDEVSFLMVDWENLDTEPWFNNDLRKITSVSASLMTTCFNYYWTLFAEDKMNSYPFAAFDSRAWNLPQEEVCNYFIWRQQDATRNSIQGLAQANFSHKQCHKLSCDQLQEKLFKEKAINWNDLPIRHKRGRCIVKKIEEYKEKEKESYQRTFWVVDEETPIFTQDRVYIEKYLL